MEYWFNAVEIEKKMLALKGWKCDYSVSSKKNKDAVRNYETLQRYI